MVVGEVVLRKSVVDGWKVMRGYQGHVSLVSLSLSLLEEGKRCNEEANLNRRRFYSLPHFRRESNFTKWCNIWRFLHLNQKRCHVREFDSAIARLTCVVLPRLSISSYPKYLMSLKNTQQHPQTNALFTHTPPHPHAHDTLNTTPFQSKAYTRPYPPSTHSPPHS